MSEAGDQRRRVVIVGAGLAGLTCARELVRRGERPLVIEAADGIGGRVRSDRVDGFVLDRGFQVLLTAYPEAQRQLDYAPLQLRAFDPGATVWDGHRFHIVADPFRTPSALPRTALAPVGSPLDKLRLLRLRRRTTRGNGHQLMAGQDVPTITALRTEGFSPAMVQSFFRPLFGGISLDPALTETRRMFDVVFRSLALGDSAVPAAGMGAIPAQLAAGLDPADIWLSTPVTGLEGTTVRLDGDRTVEADAVVVATDGPAASRLLGLDPVEGKPVSCVWFDAPTAPSDTRSIILDGTGSGPALNVAIMSNVAPSYAPAGSALIGAACPGPQPTELEPLVRAQLRAMFGPEVDRWRHLRTDHIRHGQPTQPPGRSLKRRVTLGEGRFVCGDHRDTASIQGALFSGRRTAEAVATALR